MQIATTVKEVREQVKQWKKEGLTVGLVPTMGYLHEGHQSLIKKAVEQNDKVVVYSTSLRKERGGPPFTMLFKRFVTKRVVICLYD